MMTETQVREFRAQLAQTVARWQGKNGYMHEMYTCMMDVLSSVLEEHVRPEEVLFPVQSNASATAEASTHSAEEKYRDEAPKDPSPASAAPTGHSGRLAGNETGIAAQTPTANGAVVARGCADSGTAPEARVKCEGPMFSQPWWVW